MEVEKSTGILMESLTLLSAGLNREVRVDFYLPVGGSRPEDMSLLLINDGQELEKLGLPKILGDLYEGDAISPLLCAGIHAGADRKKEYGTVSTPDYLGRGAGAGAYTDFIFKDLIPQIHRQFNIAAFRDRAFAGFSLGALSAMDIVWTHPQEFSRAGLFSGSFWWRTKDKTDPDYNERTDRIMHAQIRQGGYHPRLKFFFECGTEDEQEDRNSNGIIDSIDDTQDLIRELVAKGYDRAGDIRYLEIEGGRHDVPTWARAMPEFLQWGWGK
jgi:enterochelin esterase-like enzyme